MANFGRNATDSMHARWRLARVNTRIGHLDASVLSEYGITPVQFNVLEILINEEGISQQGLADRLLVTKGNICGLINRMEKAGLVKRHPNPTDRRSYSLYPTADGIGAYHRAAPALEAAMTQKLTRLSEVEQEQLLSLLKRLESAFS
jgi:DNA-binding MarR family transcriptional regulator